MWIPVIIVAALTTFFSECYCMSQKKPHSTPILSTLNTVQSVPRRVTNGINVSVRQQISWSKAYKRFISQSQSHNGTGKKFRKTKSQKSPEGYMEDSIVDIDYRIMAPPAIFVDGYNVIGMMNSLKGVTGIGNNLDAERESLINDLCILRGVTGWLIEVIFDAYKSPSISSKSKSKTESIDNVIVTFTSSSETADNHIERRFAELKSSGFTNMAVVTDDLVLRAVAGSNAMGMGFLTVRMLLEEISIAYRSWEQLESDMDKAMKQRTARGTVQLGDGINSKDTNDVMSALSKLKNDAANATEAAKQRQRDLKQDKRNNQYSEVTSDAGSVLSELSEKALLAGQTKVIRHDSASLAVGSLRKNTLADGLSPEMQRAMAKLTAMQTPPSHC